MPMPIFKDRVRETTTTTGTGTLTLLGAVLGYQAFSVVGNGETCYYFITDGTYWESGIGTYTSAGTLLSRDTVLASSNAGALVSFAAGTKDVFLFPPAKWFQSVPPGKNEIINGDMTVWQRGTSFAAAVFYTAADRFGWSFGGVSVVTVSRDTDVPTFVQSGHLSNYSLKIDVTTIDAAIAATDFACLYHSVEGYNFLRLAQRPMTLSFWVKAVKAGVYCVSLRNSASDRSYVAEYTINAASTWEKKTIVIPASPSAGTWNYTNGIGLNILFTLACGTTYQTTANAWQTGNYLATANQVNGVDDAANNFWLSQIKLEAGEVATPFESRTFEEELAACQRYYCKTFDYATAPAQASGTYVNAIQVRTNADGSDNYSWRFPVQMRTTPTLVTYNPTQAAATWRRSDDVNNATFTSNVNLGSAGAGLTCTAGTAGVGYHIHASADAEL